MQLTDHSKHTNYWKHDQRHAGRRDGLQADLQRCVDADRLRANSVFAEDIASLEAKKARALVTLSLSLSDENRNDVAQVSVSRAMVFGRLARTNFSVSCRSSGREGCVWNLPDSSASYEASSGCLASC